MGTLLPQQIIHALPSASQAEILGKTFFPTLLSGPFKSGLIIAFIIAAVASFLRGERVIYEEEGGKRLGEPEPVPVEVEERRERR